MQISDIFYHHKNMDMMNYIIWKYIPLRYEKVKTSLISRRCVLL